MTELEYVNCALCGEAKEELLMDVQNTHGSHFITDERFKLVKCNNCGLIYLNPRPTKEGINRFYSKEYYVTKTIFLTKIIDYFFRLAKIRSINRYRRQGKLLDLGCGGGSFLWEIKKRGFEVYGVDPSFQACKLTRERLGENIFNVELEECHFPNDYFDVVTLWHVLEHLPNPNITLREIHRILKKDGILVLETPNIDSLSFKMFRKSCFHLDIPRHFYHWSSKTIKEMLNRHKFKVFKISYFSLAYPLSLFHSFSNLLNDRKIAFPLQQLILMTLSPSLLILTISSRILPFKGEVLKIYAKIKI